jgi:nitrate/nitrite transporter NarK
MNAYYISTKLQSIGFLLTGTLFILCGMILSSSSSSSSSSSESNNDYDDYYYYDSSSTATTTNTKTYKTYIMVSMYLLSSFIGQLGPNCTTFIIPAEIFPTEQRTYAHGICAASGKVGALIAAILFHFISTTTTSGSHNSSSGNDGGNNEQEDQDQQYLLFHICGYTSYIACLITVFFIPETNNLNLLELDLQWNNIKQINREQQQQQQQGCTYSPYYSYQYYNGPANRPDHLSLYERWIKT